MISPDDASTPQRGNNQSDEDEEEDELNNTKLSTSHLFLLIYFCDHKMYSDLKTSDFGDKKGIFGTINVIIIYVRPNHKMDYHQSNKRG